VDDPVIQAGVAWRAGLIGSVAIVTTSLAAGLAWRGPHGEAYSPLSQFVSELGVRGVSELAAVFNSGLIAAGLCFSLFMLGFGQARGGAGGTASAVLGALTGFAGMLVGLLPLHSSPWHTTVAGTFFTLAWITLALASVDLLVRPDSRFAPWLAVIGFGTVAACVAFTWSYALTGAGAASFNPTPFLEWTSILGIAAWTAAVSVAWARAPRALQP
jgi:hypothetical membrane protein